VPTFKLAVEYEGTRYRGWQEQKNARTVAGELRSVLEATSGQSVELGGAGRTDAGVHALGQVAHVRLARAPSRLADWLWDINEALPSDIHVRDMAPADERFHARHHAVSRAYLYQISQRRTAFGKRFVWWVRDALQDEAMAAAAEVFRGRHDFAAFCEKPEAQTSTVVVVDDVRVARAESLWLVRVEASHFLWKMVRRLVGALVEAGRGAVAPADLAALLAEPRRAGGPRFEPARSTAPPSGLFLEAVRYAGDAALAPPEPAIRVR
jgi:tRNA pseudouridine38-40 synthase